MNLTKLIYELNKDVFDEPSNNLMALKGEFFSFVAETPTGFSLYMCPNEPTTNYELKKYIIEDPAFPENMIEDCKFIFNNDIDEISGCISMSSTESAMAMMYKSTVMMQKTSKVIATTNENLQNNLNKMMDKFRNNALP